MTNLEDRILDIEFWISSKGVTLLTGSSDKIIKFIYLPVCETTKTACDGESKILNFKMTMRIPKNQTIGLYFNVDNSNQNFDFFGFLMFLVQEIVVGNGDLMGAIHSEDSIIYTCKNNDQN